MDYSAQQVVVAVCDEEKELDLSQSLFFDGWIHFIQSMRELLDVWEVYPTKVTVFIPPECNYPVQGLWDLYLILPTGVL